MTVSWKTFLDKIKESAVSLLSTGWKNEQTAPKDTIDTAQTNKVLQSKEQEQKLADQQSTIWFKQTSQPSKYEQLMQWAERQRLEEWVAFEELAKGVQDTFIWIGNKIKNAVSEIPDMFFSKEKEKIEQERKEIKDEQRKQQQEVKKELEKQTGTNKKRENMYTVVDPYKATPQYWPYVDYRQARMNVGSIWEAMKNVTLNNDSTMAYISNGLTTVSKPVIKGNDYTKTLQDAYNAITYEYAHNWNLANAELVKKYFPAWQDASDEEINRFINECAYDVEQGKRRDISMYAENFLDLSMPDWYTSKHDAILDLYWDDEYISYWLWQFIDGTATLDWKTPEQIKQYVGAIRHINRCVEKIKEMGANTQWASNYVIAKTFANDYEWLKEALDIYQNFNLTNKDLSTIDATYTAYMEDMKDFASTPIYDDEVWMWDIIYDHFNEMSKTKILAEQDGELAFQTLNDWFMWDVYEEGGKFYNAQWNEVPRNDARIWVFKSWLQWLQGIGEWIENMKKDLDRLQSTPTDADNYFERSQVPVFDLINTAFRVWIEFTPAWVVLWPGLTQAPITVENETLKEFAETEDAPTLGRIAEAWYEKFFWWLWDDVWVKLWDMIWYTDGWSEESKAKFSESFAWLATILAAKVKGKIEKAIGKKISNTTIAKSINAMKERLVKEIEVIDELYERKKIAAKNEINKEIAPKEQIKGQEKIVDEMIDQEATNRKSMFIKEAIKNSLSDFRKTFLEEYTKEEKASGESTWPTLIDKLFKKALQLGEQMKSERAAEVKADIDSIQKWEATAPEATTEIKVEEQPTPEGEQVKVEETQVEKPGETVEQTKPATSEEKASGTAKVDEKASQQTKKQIKWILRFISDVLDIGKEIVDFNQRRYRAKKAEKAEREAENKRIVDAEALSDAWLTEEQIRQMQTNPYSETLLDIINSLTKEIKDKKGRITKVKQETSLTRDEIQREVLSKGIEKLQKHVNKLVEMRKMLKEMYWELEKRKNIDTSKFPESEPLQNVLKDYWYWIEIEVDPETNAKKATVYKLDWTDASPSEMWEMKYIEDFMNKQLKFEKKSEADLFKNRQWLKWNEDTYGKNWRSKALENSFRDAFNKFIEEQWDVKLLRTIDKWFSELSDWIDTLRELLNKDNTVKDNAKNKILKWDNEMVNQIDEIIPWFKQLVELTKVAPEIINQWVKAKRMTQNTWQKTASVVRYMFVGWAPTLIVPKFIRNLWLAAWSAAAVLLGSVLFKVSENFWLKMKHKIQWIKPDLTLYDTFVNNLKITDNEKAVYKKRINEQIKELTESAEIKTAAEFNKLVDEIAEILTERAANEIAENKLRNRGETPEEPATPEEPKGPDNTPKGPELTPEEKQIIKDASAIWEKEHTAAAEKAADAIEEIKQTIEDAQTDDATAKLEERGEDVTPESIQKEIDNPKPKTLAEELGLVTAEELWKKTETLDIREVPEEMIDKVLEDPEKYGATYDEVMEMLEEKQRRVEQYAMAEIKAQDTWNTAEDAANVEKIRELEQKKADAKTQKQKDNIQKQIDKLQQKSIDNVWGKRNTESTFEAEEALNEQADASYNKIEEWRKWLVGKFRQNSYSAQLFSEKYNLWYKKPLSFTSSVENIMSDPNPKTRARILNEKKTKLEKKIRESKYPKAKERQMAELQKVNEAIEENNKTLNAIEEKVETEKVLKEKRSKAKTREEKKELTKQIDENNKELEKLLDEQQKDLRDMPETEEVEPEYDKDSGKSPEDLELEQYHENWLKDQKARISELKENIAKREKAKEEANWDMEKWNIFDDDTLEKAKKELSDRESELKKVEENDRKLAEEEKWVRVTEENIDELLDGSYFEEQKTSKVEDGERSKPQTTEDLKKKGLTDEDIEMIENLNIASDPVNSYLVEWEEMWWMFDKEYVDKTVSALNKLDNYEWESMRWWYDNEIFWDDPKVWDIGENKGLWFSSDRDAYMDTPVLYKITSKWQWTKDARLATAKERDLISMPGTKFRLDKIETKDWQKIYEVSEVIEEKKWKTKRTKEEREILKKANDEMLSSLFKKWWTDERIWMTEDQILELEKKKKEAKAEEKKKEEPKEEIWAEPLVKQEDNGKAYAMKWNPTSKEMFERMQYLRNKAKQNWGKISFRDRSELEFLMDRYKTKLEEEAKQEYNPTEKQDLDREELWSIWWINVPTYWMSID